jgi:hypothetical protein
MQTAVKVMVGVLAPWNEEITGRAKFAAMDAHTQARQIIAALDREGLAIVTKPASVTD